MAIFTLASWATTLMTVAFALVSAFMILVILIQKPKGGGLSGAFGGGGGGGGQGAVFGAKAGDVLTKFTVGLFVAFLLLGMGLVWSTRSDAAPEPAEVRTPSNPQTPATQGGAPITPETLDGEGSAPTPPEGGDAVPRVPETVAPQAPEVLAPDTTPEPENSPAGGGEGAGGAGTGP